MGMKPHSKVERQCQCGCELTFAVDLNISPLKRYLDKRHKKNAQNRRRKLRQVPGA